MCSSFSQKVSQSKLKISKMKEDSNSSQKALKRQLQSCEQDHVKVGSFCLLVVLVSIIVLIGVLH